ncbi:MAG TPA: hypothetical protein VN877_00550 [Opitutaceae bacterium]|nr:hypothetical protein [Opitutaceae bacterium]
MTETPAEMRRMKWEMFALSFTALFLEMMVIRWVPSVVRLVAYYANLMLLSSFLGLGAGALASARNGACWAGSRRSSRATSACSSLTATR